MSLAVAHHDDAEETKDSPTSSSKDTVKHVTFQDENEENPDAKDDRDGHDRANQETAGTKYTTASGAVNPIEPLSQNETPNGWYVKYCQWFLDSAVTLREDMQTRKDRKLGPGTRVVHFPLDEEVYEQALDIVSSLVKPPAKPGSTNYPSFWSDSAAFVLQSPDPDSLEFLDDVVYRLVKDIGADLVDLGHNFLEDVLHNWSLALGERPEIFPSAAEYLCTEKMHFITSYFRRVFADHTSRLHLTDRKYLVDRLLTARSWKRSTQGEIYTPRPLIVLLPDITAYTVRWAFESDEFLSLLYDEVRRRRQEAGTPTIIVGTAPSSLQHNEYFHQSDLGREEMSHVHKKLQLDPSLVVDIRQQKSWYTTIWPPTQTRTVPTDWWSRLRLALLHELNVPDCHFEGIKLVEPYACPPSPAIHAFLTHPAWTGDMTVKAFRQIVARARRKERLETEDMVAVLSQVAKSNAPFSFGDRRDMVTRSALAMKDFISGNVSSEVLWAGWSFLVFWAFCSCILYLIFT